jgi:hypothetical protein
MSNNHDSSAQKPSLVFLKVERLKEGDPNLHVEVNGQQQLRATPLRKMLELFPDGEGEVQDRRTGQYLPLSFKEWKDEDLDNTYIKIEFHYK